MKDVFIEDTVQIGRNVVIYPFNVICGNTQIKDNSIIYPFNHIEDCVIGPFAKIEASNIYKSNVGSNCIIKHSFIEESTIESDAVVGPYSHLRPNSNIKSNVRVGNFVEIKNSVIGEGSKVSHLSYVGDAEIGKKVNVGCGVVFVNYNGKIKQRTMVGDGSFIGSSVNLIAPVKVGSRAFICAGTNIDKDVPSNSFVIGRSRMNIKPGRAVNYLKGD